MVGVVLVQFWVFVLEPVESVHLLDDSRSTIASLLVPLIFALLNGETLIRH